MRIEGDSTQKLRVQRALPSQTKPSANGSRRNGVGERPVMFGITRKF